MGLSKVTPHLGVTSETFKFKYIYTVGYCQYTKFMVEKLVFALANMIMARKTTNKLVLLN